jgi:hypothetical protein
MADVMESSAMMGSRHYVAREMEYRFVFIGLETRLKEAC